jgi:5-hydroxyisourate hydrolase
MLKDSDWHTMGKGVTNSDGRIADLLTTDTIVTAGTYRMSFETQVYLEEKGDSVFYPTVDIVFVIDEKNANENAHYHIPLLLTAFGYSTYRGS